MELDNLVNDNDRTHLFPVEFAYDCLPDMPSYLASPPLISFEFPTNEAGSSGHSLASARDSIPLFPCAAKLPWHSGLVSLRQNIHWQASLRVTDELLHLTVEDPSRTSAQNVNGDTLADFAKKELRTDAGARCTRYNTYMWPMGDEARTELLTMATLLAFLFDGE